MSRAPEQRPGVAQQNRGFTLQTSSASGFSRSTEIKNQRQMPDTEGRQVFCS